MTLGKAEKHLELNIGKLCNNSCLFCANGAVPPEERAWVPLKAAAAEMERAARKGFTSVGFLGGEITVYPHALELIRLARQLGFSRVALCTNGRRFADARPLEKFLQAGITRVALSIHSHRPEIEDRICARRGAFSQKLKAIDNLVAVADRLRDGFSLNTCIHGFNVEELIPLVDFFAQRGVKDIRLNSLRPEHKAASDRQWVPPFSRVVQKAVELIEKNEAGRGLCLTFGDIPLCLWPDGILQDGRLISRYLGELRDYDAWVTIFRESAAGKQPDRFRWSKRRASHLKMRTSACRECVAGDLCEGPWIRYCEIYGTGEFRTLRPFSGTSAGKNKSPLSQPHRSRLHVMVSAFCNNRCRFCLEDRETRRRCDFSDQLRALEIYPSRHEVLFTCGEPTLNSSLAEWIKKAAELGYRNIELVTNARRLAYRQVAEELVTAGLTAVTVSLHSHDPQTHDELTRSPGSFRQTLAGLENLLALRAKLGRPRITTSTVITRINLHQAQATADFLAELGTNCLVFNYVEPIGEALQNFSEVVPSMHEAAAVLGKVLISTKAELKIEGLPLCLLPDPACYGDRETIYIYRQGRLLRLRASRQQKKGPPCVGCAVRRWCQGVWVEYAKRFGWDEFKPLAIAPAQKKTTRNRRGTPDQKLDGSADAG